MWKILLIPVLLLIALVFGTIGYYVGCFILALLVIIFTQFGWLGSILMFLAVPMVGLLTKSLNEWKYNEIESEIMYIIFPFIKYPLVLGSMIGLIHGFVNFTRDWF